MAYNFTEIYDGNFYVAATSSITTTTGSVSIGYAGVWDGTTGTGGWSTLDGGINTGYARGIKIYSSTRMYLYGAFSSVGDDVTVSYGGNFSIARWDGTKWNSLGTLGSTSGAVHDVAYDADNDLLYAVGTFTTIYGTSANRVAVFNGTSWAALQGGANSNVYSCAIDANSDLFIGGAYGGVTNSSFIWNTSGAAKWDASESEWVSLGSTSNSVYTVRYATDTNCMYFGGSFSSMNSVSNTAKLAKYDITAGTWSSVGTFGSGLDSVIYSMELGADGIVYVAGEFVSNGTDVAYRNTSGTWTDLGASPYTITPSQSNFQPIDITVDSNGNIVIHRNAGGTYVLKAGTTAWQRVDNLSSALTVGGYMSFVSPPDITASSASVSLTVDTAMTSITISNSGDAATFTISPSLPTGLSISSSTGTISGTPTVIQINSQTYTITATNDGGTDTVEIILNVRDSYISNALTVGHSSAYVSTLNSTTLPASTAQVVTLNTLLGDEIDESTKRTKRRAIFDILFSRNNNSARTVFTTSREELGLDITFEKENLLVYKSEQIINMRNIDSTVGVYANIYNNGETVTFINAAGSQTVIFTANGNDTYTATVDGISTGDTYNAGVSYTISGYTWTMGSVYTDAVAAAGVCLGKNTDILTTNGYISIQKISKNHIVVANNNKYPVHCLVKRSNPIDLMIRFEKHSLGLNAPYKTTFTTHNHKVLYKGEWHIARDLVNNVNIRSVYLGKTNSYIYNILLKDGNMLNANGIIVESLDPDNETSYSHYA
jgi:hypothetical protein